MSDTTPHPLYAVPSPESIEALKSEKERLKLIKKRDHWRHRARVLEEREKRRKRRRRNAFKLIEEAHRLDRKAAALRREAFEIADTEDAEAHHGGK